MKHVISVLGLFLALLFSAPAWANSVHDPIDTVDYQAVGNLADGTAIITGSIASGQTYGVADTIKLIFNITTGRRQSGNDLGILDVTSGTLTTCSIGFCFVGGTIDIDTVSGRDLFQSALTSGTISKSGPTTIMSVTLPNGVASVLSESGGNFSSQALTTGQVPELSTFVLLGSGLVAMAFAFWNKRKHEVQV